MNLHGHISQLTTADTHDGGRGYVNITNIAHGYGLWLWSLPAKKGPPVGLWRATEDGTIGLLIFSSVGFAADFLFESNHPAGIEWLCCGDEIAAEVERRRAGEDAR